MATINFQWFNYGIIVLFKRYYSWTNYTNGAIVKIKARKDLCPYSTNFLHIKYITLVMGHKATKCFALGVTFHDLIHWVKNVHRYIIQVAAIIAVNVCKNVGLCIFISKTVGKCIFILKVQLCWSQYQFY